MSTCCGPTASKESLNIVMRGCLARFLPLGPTAASHCVSSASACPAGFSTPMKPSYSLDSPVPSNIACPEVFGDIRTPCEHLLNCESITYSPFTSSPDGFTATNLRQDIPFQGMQGFLSPW